MNIKTIDNEIKELAQITGREVKHIYDEILSILLNNKVSARTQQWKNGVPSPIAPKAEANTAELPPPSVLCVPRTDNGQAVS